MVFSLDRELIYLCGKRITLQQGPQQLKSLFPHVGTFVLEPQSSGAQEAALSLKGNSALTTESLPYLQTFRSDVRVAIENMFLQIFQTIVTLFSLLLVQIVAGEGTEYDGSDDAKHAISHRIALHAEYSKSGKNNGVGNFCFFEKIVVGKKYKLRN